MSTDPKNLAAQLKYRSSLHGRAHTLWRISKMRAQKLGQPHTLSKDWIITRLEVGTCERSGLSFVLKTPGVGKRGWGRVGDWSPSIDRIDSTKGYTPDNCQMVVWLYNRAKNISTDENVLLLAKALVARKER